MENKILTESNDIEEKMHEAENVLEGYLSVGSANDNKIPAAVGILNAGRTKELTSSLKNLERAIQKEASNVIESNNNFAYWTKILSISLIVVTLIVGMLQAYVIWKTSKNQNEQSLVQK